MGRFEEVLQDRLSNLKTHSIYLREDRAINLNSSDTSDRHTQQKHTSSATTSMKPDALAALATKTMRPQALEAAVVADPEQEKQATTDSRDQQQHQNQDGSSDTPTTPGTPFRTDGTRSAAKLVEDVVEGVKAAVDGALTWAEKKVDEMSSEEEHESTGPYTSPGTCAPSDMDVIASGILPAMPAARQCDGNIDEAEKKEEKAQESEKDK